MDSEEESEEEAPEKPERNITRESALPKEIEELSQEELEVGSQLSTIMAIIIVGRFCQLFVHSVRINFLKVIREKEIDRVAVRGLTLTLTVTFYIFCQFYDREKLKKTIRNSRFTSR